MPTPLESPSRRFAVASLAVLGLVASWLAPAASAAPLPTRIAFAPARIVPVPAAIPHSPGAMIDRRLVPNLRWLSRRFPIYVTEGYSGRLPGGGRQVGCRGCHVKNSDHHNGLAVDIVPLRGGGRCDRAWRGVTRLARWAEPRQNRPRAPFRWVGYDGDRGHGCGHHLHLSWEHAAVREFRVAPWVEVLSVGFKGIAPRPQPQPKPPAAEPPPAEPQPEPGPSGGVSTVRSGGVSAQGR